MIDKYSPAETGETKTTNALAFLSIMATMGAGYTGAPWWTALCGTLALSAISRYQNRAIHKRANQMELGGQAFIRGVLPSVAISGVTATAAYVGGQVVRAIL